MTNLREAAQMALETLVTCRITNEFEPGSGVLKEIDDSITALRAALAQPEPKYEWTELSEKDAAELKEAIEKERRKPAQPEQEPIAWIVITEDGLEWEDNHTIHPVKQNGDWFQFPVYLPSQRERIMCGCGDQIMPDDGAECGTCVTARNATQREWQGLTDDDFIGLTTQQIFSMKFAEAKLKEKNND